MRKLIKKIPFISGLFHSLRPYHTGNVTENKIGLQVVRVLGLHFSQSMRGGNNVSKNNEDNLKALKKDGIIEFKKFLSDEDWNKVIKEYNDYKDKLVFQPYKPAEKFSMEVAKIEVNKLPQYFPSTIQIMGNNVILNELACSILHLNPKKIKPSLSYLILRKNNNNDLDDDIENILHADVHYRTVKAFLYMNPATSHNGAYIYAKGSNKLNLARLRFEYNMSVRVAKLKRGDTDIAPEYIEKRGNLLRNIISEKQRKEMKINEIQYSGDANTLVLSDNFGFHRRGEFEPNQIRETLIVNYRNEQTGWLRRFLNK